MNRRKFFGVLFGAAAAGAVAPKALARNTPTEGSQPTPPKWKTPPELPQYVLETHQRVLTKMLIGMQHGLKRAEERKLDLYREWKKRGFLGYELGVFNRSRQMDREG